MSFEGQNFNFQVHHIFPSEVFGDPLVRAFLDSAGITEDAKSNKIALLGNQNVVDVWKVGSSAFKNKLLEAGWGLTKHNGFHPEYNDFIENSIRSIMESGLSPAKQKLAVFDLHRFATELAKGTTYPSLDVYSTETALEAGL